MLRGAVTACRPTSQARRGTSLSSFAPPQAHASSGAQRSLPHQTIDVVDMVLGVSIVVPLLDGQQSLDIRAGVQPDTMLRIVGGDFRASAEARTATSTSDFRFVCRNGSPIASDDRTNS